MNLKDAVAVITGGGSGLGAATAQEFAERGAKVAILDLPSSPGAKVAESFAAKGLFVAADVTSGAEVETAVAKAAEHFATLHIAIKRCLEFHRTRYCVSRLNYLNFATMPRAMAGSTSRSFSSTRGSKDLNAKGPSYPFITSMTR